MLGRIQRLNSCLCGSTSLFNAVNEELIPPNLTGWAVGFGGLFHVRVSMVSCKLEVGSLLEGTS